MDQLPEILTSTEGLMRLASLIVGEITAILVFAALLLWLLRLVFNRLESAAAAEALSLRINSIRRLLRTSIIVLSLLGILGLLAFNSWLVWTGHDPLTRSIELVSKISPQAWRGLGLALLKIIAVILAAKIIVRWITRLLSYLENRAESWGQIHANDESISAFFRGLSNVLVNFCWMLIAVFAAIQLSIPELLYQLLLSGVTIYLIIGVGLIIVRTVAVIVDTLNGLSRKVADGREWQNYYDAMDPLIPLLRRCLEYVIWIGTATLVLAQLSPIAQFAEYGPRLIQVIGVFFLTRVAIEVGNLLIENQMIGDESIDELERRRRQTVTPLFKSIFRQLAWFIALVIILGTLGVDIMPFLAGAGILGVVIGLGAQPLINDVVSGFFILFENIYLVGDFVDCGKAKGTVEGIEFRTTRLRDPDGNLHIIRNGDMNHVKNYSKSYTFAVVEIAVGYDEDIASIRRLLTECGEQLRKELPDMVKEPLEVRGIVEFQDSGMRFRTTTRVGPGQHFPVATRLREIIRGHFSAAGIPVPYDKQLVTLQES